jgi:hypothetical protein
VFITAGPSTKLSVGLVLSTRAFVFYACMESNKSYRIIVTASWPSLALVTCICVSCSCPLCMPARLSCASPPIFACSARAACVMSLSSRWEHHPAKSAPRRNAGVRRQQQQQQAAATAAYATRLAPCPVFRCALPYPRFRMLWQARSSAVQW